MVKQVLRVRLKRQGGYGSKDMGALMALLVLAVAAMSVAYERGFSVPEDISVIGYDNTSTAEMAIPPLTCVSQPLYDMGKKSFFMLKDIIEGRAKVE